MTDTHYFKVEHAEKYGITEAILLSHFELILSNNRANNRNFHDGLWWSYNTIEAYSKLFPYLSQSKIRRALKHLEEEGLIVFGNYNRVQFDRTKWYALTAKGWAIFGNAVDKTEPSICQNEQIRTDQNEQISTAQNDGTIPGDTRRYQEIPKRERRFAPPTRDEVAAYAEEKGYTGFNADRFIAFYESNGWKVGRNPMKNWKAAVSGWHSRDQESKPRTQNKPKEKSSFQRWMDAEFERGQRELESGEVF